MITVALSVLYTVMTIVVLGGCPGGELTPECNPSLIDTTAPWAVHVYGQGTRGHDPEGMVATFGALISVAAGATIGHAILHGRSYQRYGRKASLIGGLAAGLALMAALCVVLPTFFGLAPTPVMKRLWTAPFALFVAAGVTLALLGLHALMDDPRTAFQRTIATASYPLLALGKNSLLVYFGSHIISSWARMFPTPEDSFKGRLVESLGGGPAVHLAIPLVTVLAWVAVAIVLHRRRIYVRA